MNISANYLMKFILPAAAALLVLAVLTAGCVSSTGSDTTDPETVILGDWKYTFTRDDGSETTMTYHFDSGNEGTFSTGKGTYDIVWGYDEENKMYVVNYFPIMTQGYFIYGKDGNTEYLISDGEYALTRA
ncbi:MAG TPA: hypothetical protein O0X42_05520 [Methanocorpusculum sp.]|nr:hypothetical protein [Methanocorpusculum sp.]